MTDKPIPSMLIYRGHFLQREPDGTWTVMNDRKRELHKAPSEDAAHKWVDEKRRRDIEAARRKL